LKKTSRSRVASPGGYKRAWGKRGQEHEEEGRRPRKRVVNVYYFGCRFERKHDIGHFLWLPGMRSGFQVERTLPEGVQSHKLDGVYPPGGTAYTGGKRDYRNVEVEGVARVAHVDGYTVLAFWDRSADERGASNSAFVVEGEHDFDAALSASREAFPQVFARFKFQVVQDPAQAISQAEYRRRAVAASAALGEGRVP
jgi:hypothetical protein